MRVRGADKLAQNQQLADLVQALGCGTRGQFREADLRYDKVIIMTDADVDGAHIASLLITFFYREMPQLIRDGHLYSPCRRSTNDSRRQTIYARNDAHREELMATVFKGKKPEVGRFKGLGEMMPGSAEETTMDPKTRTLLRVEMVENEYPADRRLRRAADGEQAGGRFQFIQENAEFARDLDI